MTTGSRRSIRTVVLFSALFGAAWGEPWRLLAQSPKPATNVRYAQIAADDMKGWLTYLASDQLQGRQVFTEGYGLAAQYIASHLAGWSVKPLGADGTSAPATRTEAQGGQSVADQRAGTAVRR